MSDTETKPADPFAGFTPTGNSAFDLRRVIAVSNGQDDPYRAASVEQQLRDVVAAANPALLGSLPQASALDSFRASVGSNLPQDFQFLGQLDECPHPSVAAEYKVARKLRLDLEAA